MSQEGSLSNNESPKRKQGLLRDQVQLTKSRKDPTRYEIIPIPEQRTHANTKPEGIVHGDLKPANILLDSTYTCKLSDLGICRTLAHKTTIPKGTFCYICPEYLQTGEVTTHNDVFPFGVVLLQLVTGKADAMALRMLVGNALESGKFNEVVDALANWPLDVAEKMSQLGLRCMEWNKKDRPDLANEVWIEIESMEQVASCS